MWRRLPGSSPAADSSGDAERGRGSGVDGSASGCAGTESGTVPRPGLAILVERGRTAAPSPRGVMQRDLVTRARRGDHDAFSELAGAAISRLDSAAWLILRDPEQAADAVQKTRVRALRDLSNA